MNKWIVLSPGRAASTLLSVLLAQRDQTNPLPIIHQHITGEEPDFHLPETGFVWHTHFNKTLDFLTPNTNLVIITRSIFEITASYEIARRSGVFNVYHRPKNVTNKMNKKIVENIKSFHIPVWKFLYEYDKLKQWHIDCRTILKERNITPYTIIDYKDISEDNNKLYQALHLPTTDIHEDFTIKLPYDAGKLITNLAEIYNAVDHSLDNGYKILTS